MIVANALRPLRLATPSKLGLAIHLPRLAGEESRMRLRVSSPV